MVTSPRRRGHGYPQRMSSRELLIAIRTSLGLSHEALADMLGNAPRTVQYWEAKRKAVPIPPGVWSDLAALEQRAEDEVSTATERARAALLDGATPRIVIDPAHSAPIGWQRMIAGRVHRDVPELIVDLADPQT